jgi:hypothetical protein
VRAQARLPRAGGVPLASLPCQAALWLVGAEPRGGGRITLAPLVSPGIRGVEGKPAQLDRWCVAPACISLAQQRHHLWPKSYLRGQPYEWVQVFDQVIPNSVGLCVRHHNEVTGLVGGHVAHIRWNKDLGLFEWWEKDAEFLQEEVWVGRGPLKGQGFVPPEPEAARARRSEALCPTCGKPKARHSKPLPKRKAKSWKLLVPDDAEVGADVLDTYIENLAALMGLNRESPRLLRYHVLVPVLEWVSQQQAQFIADWEDT